MPVAVPTSAAVLAAGHSPVARDGHVDLLVFLAVGLLAGAHCLGMCGPLVTTYANRMESGERRRDDELTVYEVRQHLLFNLGRTGSYAALGGGVALIGGLAIASVDRVAAVGDAVRGIVGILAGVLILTIGVYYLRGRPGTPRGAPVVGPAFARISGAIAGRVDRLVNSPGIVGLGAIHGLLPCPIVYPAYLYAFALGDPVRGALSLAALGLGTAPALFVYGTLLGSLDATTRVRLHRALGVAFLVLGYVPLQHGLALYGIHLPHPPIPFYQPL